MACLIVILPLAFIILGFVIIAKSIAGLRESLQARTWPQAKGTILTVERKGDAFEGTEMHEVKVAYEYHVEGQTLQGDCINRFYCASSEFDVQHELEQKLANAKHVTVYYNPCKPQRSMLVPGFQAGSLLGMGGGIIFVCIGLLFPLGIMGSGLKDDFPQAIHVVQP